MKRQKIANYLKLGILLFGISLLLWNCEKEDIFIEKIEAPIASLAPDITYLQKDQFPAFINEFTGKFGAKSTLGKGNSDVSYVIETNFGAITFDKLMEVTDKNGNVNYTCLVMPKKASSKVFHNFVMNKEQQIPLVYEYIMSDAFALKNKNGDANFNEFSGTIKKYTLIDQGTVAKNKFSKVQPPGVTVLYPQPCPGSTTIYNNTSSGDPTGNGDTSDDTTDDGSNSNDGSSGGGGTSISYGTCQFVVAYTTCRSGGGGGHLPAKQFDGSYCEGSIFITAYLVGDCNKEDTTTSSKSSKSNNTSCYGDIGEIGLLIPNTYAGYFDTLITKLQLTNDEITWLAGEPVVAFSMFLFLEFNAFSVEVENFAYEFIKAKRSNNYSDFFNLAIFNQDPYSVWKSISQAERDLIKQYPTEAYNIFKNRDIATNATFAKFNSNGLNDKSDAFRHAYYNIINTKVVGITIAKLFSDAHESETPTALTKEKEMDLFNNNIGQQSLLGNSALSLSELIDVIYQKMLSGDLRYLSPINGNDPNFQNTHGITVNTQLIPTNQ